MPTIDGLASYHVGPLAGLFETPQWQRAMEETG